MRIVNKRIHDIPWLLLVWRVSDDISPMVCSPEIVSLAFWLVNVQSDLSIFFKAWAKPNYQPLIKTDLESSNPPISAEVLLKSWWAVCTDDYQ